MNNPPQTFDAIIKAISEQPAAIRPNHLFFLWFTMEQTTEHGIITLAGSSSMSWRADITFKEMQEFGDLLNHFYGTFWYQGDICAGPSAKFWY